MNLLPTENKAEQLISGIAPAEKSRLNTGPVLSPMAALSPTGRLWNLQLPRDPCLGSLHQQLHRPAFDRQLRRQHAQQLPIRLRMNGAHSRNRSAAEPL